MNKKEFIKKYIALNFSGLMVLFLFALRIYPNEFVEGLLLGLFIGYIFASLYRVNKILKNVFVRIAYIVFNPILIGILIGLVSKKMFLGFISGSIIALMLLFAFESFLQFFIYKKQKELEKI